MTELTPVQQYYKDKTIFITGASGFMGKVLLEKLLYSCPALKEIIIVVRPKRGKTPEARLEDFFKLPLFHRIRESNPEVFKKVTLYQGDVTFDNLGLNGDSLKHVIDNTHIVFHMAATLKLEGNLTDAINMNTTGTKRALDIAKQMKNLEAFVHLSTAFCNCDQEVAYEKVYDFPHKPEDLMRLAEWMDVKALDRITPELLKPHPNTYTYSKRLAELLVRDHYETMPVIIARPSIVSPSAFEPVPGWVDNLNGPTGLMVGAGKGVIRSMLIDMRYKSEVIPVDYAINGLVVIPYQFNSHSERPTEVPVYNITCADHRKLPWGEVIELSKKIGYQYPLEAGLWYPDGCITTNWFHHRINVILFHWLPAYVIDFILFLLGQKRFMIRVQNRVQIGLEVLQFFTMRAWIFKSDLYASLWQELTSQDKTVFNMNMDPKEDIEMYITSCVQGGREYLMKELPESLPRARLQLKLPAEVPVYNITNAEHRKAPLGPLIEMTRRINEQYPLNAGLWYPEPCITTNKLYHQFNVIFFHWLPAYLLDFLMLILGQKRFMVRVQQKISTGLEVLQFFTLNPWHFKPDRYIALWDNLTPKDKEIFNMNMDPENTEEEYMIECAKGARLYILKEKLEDIPKARVHLKIMWAVDRICKTVICGLFFYYVLKWTGVLALLKPQHVPVYNLTIEESKKRTWGWVLEMGRDLGKKYPFEVGLWYPEGNITTNKAYHYFCVFFFMWLPAYFIDLLLMIFGQTRFMVRVQNKIAVGLDVLQFFTTRSWDFKSHNFHDIYKNIVEKDRKIFKINTEDVDDLEYMRISLLGGRQYVMKEPLSSLPRARTQLKFMYFLDRLSKTIILGSLTYWVVKKLGIMDMIYGS